MTRPVTPMQNRHALVLGASGGAGSAISAALLQHGWSVRAMARDLSRVTAERPDIEWVSGDVMNAGQVLSAAKNSGAPARIIVHAVNPAGYLDWDKLALPMIDNTIAAARTVGARIVLPGTVYNYDPRTTLVIDERTEQNATSRKGRIRVQMERRLANAGPQVTSLVLRAGDFYGPGARSSWFAQAMVTPGKPVSKVTSLGDAPHAYAYLPDLAKTFALLLDRPEVLRPVEVLQFPGTWDATGHDMIGAIRRVVGRDVSRKSFPWWAMRIAAPFGGFAREAVEIEPFWRNPMSLDGTRLAEILGTIPHTPIDDAVLKSLVSMGCAACARSEKDRDTV